MFKLNILIIVLILSTLGCKKTEVDNLSLEKEFNNYQLILLDLHNKERNKRNIKELILNQELCFYAKKHAKLMSDKNNLFHSDLEGFKEIEYKTIGENIACGQKSEQEVLESWMWSPMHKWNILRKNYKKVGFGLMKSKKGYNYWCTVFTD